MFMPSLTVRLVVGNKEGYKSLGLFFFTAEIRYWTSTAGGFEGYLLGDSHGGGGSEGEKDWAPGFMLENLLRSRRVLGRVCVWRGEELCGGGR